MATVSYPEDLDGARLAALDLVELTWTICSIASPAEAINYWFEWFSGAHQDVKLDQFDFDSCPYPKLKTWLNARSIISTARERASTAITPILLELPSTHGNVTFGVESAPTGHELALVLGDQISYSVRTALMAAAGCFPAEPPDPVDVKDAVMFFSWLQKLLPADRWYRYEEYSKLRSTIEGECRTAIQSRGSVVPKVSKDTVAPPQVLSAEVWKFEAAGFWFKETWYDLSGYPLKLLAIFVGSPSQQTFGYRDLATPWGDSGVSVEETIRSHLATLRAVLRRVAFDAKESEAAQKDPLPSRARAWRFLLPRE